MKINVYWGEERGGEKRGGEERGGEEREVEMSIM